MTVFKIFNYLYLKGVISGYLRVKSPFLWQLLNRHKILVKYIFAGGAAVAVNLSFLYLATEIFRVWYVLSAIIAFFASYAVGFWLQKFWTFRDNNVRRIKRQMAWYAIVGILNLVLDPLLLYALVETFDIWYVLAQLLIMSGLAIESYLINRFITFKKDASYESVDD